MIPLPAWDGVHPLVVHFPIALLVVVPLLVAIGLVAKPERAVGAVALLLLAIGTAAAWVAVGSGEAAGRLVERTPEVSELLDRHEELAVTTRTVFTVLTLAFGGLLALPRVLGRPLSTSARVGLHGAFLVAYLAGMVSLALTAHQGGRLVHQQGVHALMGG